MLLGDPFCRSLEDVHEMVRVRYICMSRRQDPGGWCFYDWIGRASLQAHLVLRPYLLVFVVIWLNRA